MYLTQESMYRVVIEFPTRPKRKFALLNSEWSTKDFNVKKCNCQRQTKKKVVIKSTTKAPSLKRHSNLRKTFQEWHCIALPNRCCHHTFFCYRWQELPCTISGSIFFHKNTYSSVSECGQQSNKACDTRKIFSSSKHNFPISS